MSINIQRTGRLFSDSSVEFLVTLPDRSQHTLWSPMWSGLEYDDPKQDEGAMQYAERLWAERQGKG